VLATVHRAKGREWDRIELGADLPRVPADAAELARAPDPEAARAEANLLYVAATRARRELGLGRVRDDVKELLSGGGAQGGPSDRLVPAARPDRADPTSTHDATARPQRAEAQARQAARAARASS
jgi:superfamily I DNA/RNA helicase